MLSKTKDAILEPFLEEWLKLENKKKVQYLAIIADALVENTKIHEEVAPKDLIVKVLDELGIKRRGVLPVELLMTLYILISRIKLGYLNND